MTVRDTQIVRDQKKFENHWPRGIRALLCYVYFAEVDPLLQPFLFSGLKLAE